MPDFDLILLFIYQVIGQIVLLAGTFICAFAFILFAIFKIKDWFTS